MWPYIIFLALLAVLHFWWRAKYRALHDEWRHETDSRTSAQKRHYEETSQIEAEQQAVFNSMAEGVLILDEHGRIQLVNRSFRNCSA